MTDAQVRRMVNWEIAHGCITEADIPEDKVVEILREPTHNDTQTKIF